MIEFNATFIVAMFSFIVFIFIMNAIFYNPILSIIRKREDYINSNLQDAKDFEKIAAENNTQYSTKINKTQDKCRNEIKLEVGAAHAAAGDSLRSAKEAFKSSIMQMKHNISMQGEILNDELKHTVIEDLANSVVSKIINNSEADKNRVSTQSNKVLE